MKISFNSICIFVILVVLIILLVSTCKDYFKENYSPFIVRALPCNKNNNTCKFPLTNNKLDTTTNPAVYQYQYANRFIKNPDQYYTMVRKLLEKMSKKQINVSQIPDELLTETDYPLDTSIITNFMNSEIDKLIEKEPFLQENGPWKYERFFTSDPTIFLYTVNNKNKLFFDLPNEFFLFKIMYTLGNPLRSSYSNCFAFITVINNKYEIQYTSLTNDIQTKSIADKLSVVPSEALKFSFLNTIAQNDFDQFGFPNDYSGINYIEEFRDGKPVNIKADIPNEFKVNSFQPQYLPPQFGNCICDYPPIYDFNNDGLIENKVYNSPPLY